MNAEANSTPPMPSAGPCGETLSCMLDGELDALTCAQLLERLRSDEQARNDWMLMAAAGDALRSSEVAAWHSASFVARMSAALAVEPAIVAPRLSRRRVVRRVILPGAAVAAAAVVLAVVALPELRRNASATLAASSAPAGVVGVAAPVEAPVDLEAYLLAHREAAGGTVMPRSAAYLRTSTTPTTPTTAPR